MILGLLACTPPSLQVVAPTGPTRDGVLTIDSDARWVQIRLGEHVFDVEDGRFPLALLGTGAHELQVVAGGFPRAESSQMIQVAVDVSAPRVELAERALQVEQGHTLPIVLRTDEAAMLTAEVLEKERILHPVASQTGEPRWRALVGVPIRQPAGPVELKVTARDALGNQAVYTTSIEVLAVEWPFTGKLPLSKKKATVPAPDIVKMRSERDPVYAMNTPEALWNGTMQIPTEGRSTSAFGTYREYPDGKRSHHDAEDIARRRGTPVYAAAEGVVELAHHQAVHGNAILLGHGQGVVTLYSHLDRLDVRAGQHVERGDLLGAMGSTGRSTGPHLHWGIVVDGIPVDPMQWTETPFDGESFERFVPLTPVGP